MLAISKKGFINEALGPGDATVTSQVIRMDSPWAVQFFQFIVPSEIVTEMGCQLQISPDSTNWANHGDELLSGKITATVFSTSTWGMPAGSKYVRFLAGNNSDDTVTVNTWVSMVTDMKRDFA